MLTGTHPRHSFENIVCRQSLTGELKELVLHDRPGLNKKSNRGPTSAVSNTDRNRCRKRIPIICIQLLQRHDCAPDHVGRERGTRPRERVHYGGIQRAVPPPHFPSLDAAQLTRRDIEHRIDPPVRLAQRQLHFGCEIASLAKLPNEVDASLIEYGLRYWSTRP